ncbi:quinone-interacting membrane-bound oxidoreductase complex subunit QmoC [candidate division KSB1 bacterium]
MSERLTVDPDVDFIKTIKAQGGESVKKCYQCATCSVVCKLSDSERAFPRKEMIWAQWGLKDRLLGDPGVWLCHQCNDCSQQCPRGAEPGNVLAGIRAYIYEKFAFPGFMGKVISSPKSLPFMLLGILGMFIVLLSLIHKSASLGFDIPDLKNVGYAEFLPHIWAEGLFVTGNVIIFMFAAMGFLKFWNYMKKSNNGEAPAMISSILKVIGDVIAHTRFNKCGENKSRYIAHLLVFYGFIGAMITAGLAVFFTTFIEIVPSPIPLLHPIKLLGMASGMGVIIGSIMMLSRRSSDPDLVGANGYSDKLFLYMVFSVGLTGMLTLFARLSGISQLGYGIYVIHLVVVFFLLWFMPYSKFAHMIYRFLAMAFAKGVQK